jgi:hypothetical protein
MYSLMFQPDCVTKVHQRLCPGTVKYHEYQWVVSLPVAIDRNQSLCPVYVLYTRRLVWLHEHRMLEHARHGKEAEALQTQYRKPTT